MLPTGVHRWLRWILLALCVFFALHGVHAGRRAIGSDFTIFYRAGEAILAGRDPTQVERFLYPPGFALAMAPLALLSYTLALVLWQAASLAALAWITARTVAWCRQELGSARAWLGWLPMLACLRLIDSNFSNGQVNLLVLALVVAAIDAFLRQRSLRAGVLLGCATALKVLPGGLVLVFLVRREGRAFSAWLAALAGLLLLPAVVLGPAGNLASLEHWWRSQPAVYLQGGEALLEERGYLPGQSLTATAYRLLSASPATSRGEDGPTAEVVDLDPESVKWILRGLSAAALVTLLGALVVPARRSPPGARLRECALVMCFVLLLGPLVHKAHMVWVLVPFALLLNGPPPEVAGNLRGARLALILFAIAAIGLTTPALLGRPAATWMLAHDAIFFGLAALTGALLLDVQWAGRARDRT